jgi:hypothetical protein
VVLAHVSENCNDHLIAATAMRGALRPTRFRGSVSVALQHGVVGPFTPAPGRGAPIAEQLALGL